MNENDLVFVVQSSGGPTAGRDKSIINAHVSKQTHSRRRKERALQFQRRISLSNDQDRLLDFSTADYLTSALETYRSSSLSSGSDSTSPQRLLGRRNSAYPHKSSRLYIDSKAENYLHFGRDVLEPAIRRVGHRGWVATQANLEISSGPDILSASDTILPNTDHASFNPDRHNVLIFASLAYCASGVATVHANEQAQCDALSYAINCMKSMRRYLAHSIHLEDIPEDLVYRLYQAEVLASNYASASTHGTLLRRIFEGKANSTSGLRYDTLSNTLYQDGHRMFGSWTKPIFDEAWVEERYREDWHKADCMFDSTLEQEARTVSRRNVPDPRLATIFVNVRRLFLQTRIMLRRQLQADSENIHWFETRCEWLQICLMNYYQDLEQQTMVHKAEKKDTELHLCLALAALYVLRHTKNEIRVNGKPLFSGSDNVFMRLDSRLKLLAQSMTTEDIAKYSDSIAFMLFVAAMAEHYSQQALSMPANTWFWRKKFAQFLQQRGLKSWWDMCSVFRSFPYTEEELPLPHETWFEEIMWEQKPT